MAASFAVEECFESSMREKEKARFWSEERKKLLYSIKPLIIDWKGVLSVLVFNAIKVTWKRAYKYIKLRRIMQE